MKFFHTLLTAGLLTSTALLAQVVKDPYSGFQVEIPDSYEMDEDWTDIDSWGSEFMFVDQNGSIIEIEIEPLDEDDDCCDCCMPDTMEFTMHVRAEDIEKDGRTGKIVEVRVNDQAMSSTYYLKDDEYSYLINFIRVPEDVNENGMIFAVPEEGTAEFPAVVDQVINSLQFQK